MEKQYHILLIDDDEDDRMLFKYALEMSGDQAVCTAISGWLGALDILGSGKLPDVIFLDLNMPEMHGLDCLKLLKESPVYGHVPVIIYSTSRHHVDIKKAGELGAQGYLKKQSDIDDLRNRIKQYISHIVSGNPAYLCDSE